MLSKIKKKFGLQTPDSAYENVDCRNCGTHFSGHFCPNCGQAVKETDKPISFVIYNFMGDFFAFDTRFFRTLFALLFKPGFLTKEYFDGRIVRYAPPFRVFIFMSFVLFLILQVYTNRGLTTILDTDLKDWANELDSTAVGRADSIIADVATEFIEAEVQLPDTILSHSLYVDEPDTIKVKSNDLLSKIGDMGDIRDLRHALDKIALSVEEELEEETDPEKRQELLEVVRLLRSPESALAKILKYISWAFFVLLPVFAILLGLVYIRRKHNYIKHLIFSVHIHAYIFLVFITIIGLYFLLPNNQVWLFATFFVIVPVYIIIAMKRFYGQGLRKVLLKFFVLSFLYNICFNTIVFIAVLNALNFF